jgi:hypothetical protein
MGRHKKETLISPTRTPVDTIDSALNDLDRQNASLEQMLKVNRQLRSGMEQAREKAVAALESRHIRLLPASAEPDTGTRNPQCGFLRGRTSSQSSRGYFCTRCTNAHRRDSCTGQPDAGIAECKQGLPSCHNELGL